MIFVVKGTGTNQAKRNSAVAEIRPFHGEGLCGSYQLSPQTLDWSAPGS